MDVTTALADACFMAEIISSMQCACFGAPSAESTTRHQSRPISPTVGNAPSAYSIRLVQIWWRDVVKSDRGMIVIQNDS
jgi:hypothetical protein